MSLTRKFVANILVGVTLTSAGLMLLLTRHERSVLVEQLRRKGENLARLISGISADPIVAYNYMFLDGYVRDVAKDPDVSYVVIFDRDGKPLTRQFTVPAIGTRHLVEIAEPIFQAGERIGTTRIGLSTAGVERALRQSQIIIVALSLINMFLTWLIVYVLFRRIVFAAVEGVKTGMVRVAAGDLSREVEVRSEDEIGALGRATNKMIADLTHLIGASQQHSQRLDTSAGSLAAVAQSMAAAFRRQIETLGGITDAVGDMDHLTRDLSAEAVGLQDAARVSSSSTADLAKTIAVVSRTIAEIRSHIESVALTVSNLSSTVTAVAASAERTAKVSEEAREAVGVISAGIGEMEQMAEESRRLSEALREIALKTGAEAIKRTPMGIRTIQESAELSDQAIRELQDGVQSISGIVAVIDQIAQQTNLLALNAAIISSQAGEHGRGFSVIAVEVRDLSAKTSAATTQITQLIATAQNAANTYYDYQKRVMTSVKVGLDLGREAEAALDRIVVSADDVTSKANSIAKVTAAQVGATRRLAESVQVFADAALAIKKATHEEAQVAVSVSESMQRVRDMVGAVDKSTEGQNRGSKVIAQSAERVMQAAERVHRVTVRQQDLSATIVQAIQSLQSLTNTSSAEAQSIETCSSQMTQLSSFLQREMIKFQIRPPSPDGSTN